MLPMNFPLYKATMDVYSKKTKNDNFDFGKSESFKAAVAEAVQQAMGNDGARLEKCNDDLQRERNNAVEERKTTQVRIAQLAEERDRLQKELAELRPTVERDLRNEREARQQLRDNLKDLRRHLAEGKHMVARDVAANEAEIARLREERGRLETQLAECRRTGEQNREAERIALDKERAAKDELQRLLDESRTKVVALAGERKDFETKLAECRETVASAERAQESERRVLEFIKQTSTIMTAFIRQEARGRDADYSAFPEQIEALASKLDDGRGVGDALDPLKEILSSFKTITRIVLDVSTGIEYLLAKKRALEEDLQNCRHNCDAVDEELKRVNAELERSQELLRKQTEESVNLHAEMSWLHTVLKERFEALDKKIGERLERFERFVAEKETQDDGEDDVGRFKVPDSVKTVMGNRRIPPGSPKLDNPSSPLWNDEYMRKRIETIYDEMFGLARQNLDGRFQGGGAEEKKTGSASPTGDKTSDGDDGSEGSLFDSGGYRRDDGVRPEIDFDALVNELNDQFKKPPSFDELGDTWTEALAEELHDHVMNPVSPRTNAELVDRYTHELLRDMRYTPNTGDDTQDAMEKMSLLLNPNGGKPIPKEAFDDIHETFRFVTHGSESYNLSQTHAFHAFGATRKYLLDKGYDTYADSPDSNVRLFLLVVSKTGIEFRDFGKAPFLFLFPPDPSASSALLALFPWL